jgi:hypothetical protein
MNTPDARTVLEALQEPQAYGGNPPDWNEAMTALPRDPLPFLDKAALPGRIGEAGLLENHIGPLSDMIDLVAADGNLRLLAWYLHWRTFLVPQKGVLWGAPPLEKRLGPAAGLFYMLLALEFPPRLRAYHRGFGYPEEVTRETIRQLSCYEFNHLHGRGTQGVYERQFPWLSNYFLQPFVRLGRLEYQMSPYRGGVNVWKRSSDGAVLALADGGSRVDGEGLLAEADADSWTTLLKEADGSVAGHPVDPAGAVRRKEVRLPRPGWAPYLRAGDPVLNLHIPSGGGMDWVSVTDSFRKAVDFFKRYHPDRPWKALVVGTWFMDPRLDGLLPPDGNPIRFQHAVHLYPTPPQPDSLWFVFLRPVAGADPSSLPRETSLQRTLAGFLESGKNWHGGGMFLLPEDMEDPQPDGYRKRFRSLARELGIDS